VFVGVGANLGDARAAVLLASRELAALPGSRLVQVSSLYRTAPIDAQGPDFCNAVAELASSLDPLALLKALQGIEIDHGRQRPYTNAPRTLDLDLLMYGQRLVEQPELTLPHPRMHQRAFVLYPLLELAPHLAHPRLGPIAVLAARLGDQRVERLG
jgi:2-amino-4-hydroxy-6-hydroxymethyldihydropteridine diphosphokinase